MRQCAPSSDESARVVGSLRLNALCNALDQVTVRIDEREAMAGFEVLKRHRF
jgi:hypothetical protein